MFCSRVAQCNCSCAESAREPTRDTLALKTTRKSRARCERKLACIIVERTLEPPRAGKMSLASSGRLGRACERASDDANLSIRTDDH